MSKELTVNITQKNIDDGEKGDCETCAVSLALIDLGFPHVSVGYENAIGWLTPVKKGFEFNIPEEMVAFICAFDSGAPVAPTTFIVPCWQEPPSNADILHDLNLTDAEWRNS